jgi:alkylhydroperoxidase family enzyme
MALRVPKAQLPAELREQLIKQFGAVPEPVEVSYNNPRVALSSQEYAAKVATWDAVEASLKTFAHMAVAESEVFTPLERDVLEYAEAMTTTPTTVTGELAAGLRERLGPAALVELTVFIGFANLASRVNTAHGIKSQGYSDACEIPLAARPEKSVVAST